MKYRPGTAVDSMVFDERPRVSTPPSVPSGSYPRYGSTVNVDSTTGRERQLWCLVVTLSFSRMQFVWPSFEQTTEVVCEGLDAAWAFFGGKAW